MRRRWSPPTRSPQSGSSCSRDRDRPGVKTGSFDPAKAAAAIVRLADGPSATDDGVADALPLQRARAFAEPLLAGRLLPSGEPTLDHADAVAAILQGIGAAPSLRAAAYLVYAGDHLNRPEAVIAQAFGASAASVVAGTRRLMQLQRAARGARVGVPQRDQQIERVRKMLLAFSRDLRVVLLRLASRLQTLRFFAATRLPCPTELAEESLQVFAPLANRLGIWQVKWEMEDLAFRFLQPDDYRTVARLLDERRALREERIEAFRRRLSDDLAAHGLPAEVHGRPKHIYSIWKKMQGKRLDFHGVLDLRAVRVIVADVPACYLVLGRVHELFRSVAGEFDDYIERPKPNGYQSLHTVVQDDQGRAVEVQVRTRAMHEHAEHGVAAHWAYKDAGAKGYAGLPGDADQGARIAEARKAVLRELLAWERDVSHPPLPGQGQTSTSTGKAIADLPSDEARAPAHGAVDARIYVFTPLAAVIELPEGATPVDFAYSLHTDLGHRCRGARVDGAMVPLSTPLRSGQTVEIVTTRDGSGPSLDWLNPELGYLRSPRARAKVRAWYNLLAQRATIARGREAVEKLLQRESRTAMRLGELAAQLGFATADALFEVVGKDELSLRTIETLLRPAALLPTPDQVIAGRRANSDAPGPKGGVLVVGVDSLLTSLARCCRPAPPDAIGGYVTRGKGVAVHRASCSNYRSMVGRSPERVITVAWGTTGPGGQKPSALFPVDVVVQAEDRQGLLRDLTELFAREQMNVTGVRSRSVPDSSGGTAWMTFTLEVADSGRLTRVLALADRIDGVRAVRRG